MSTDKLSKALKKLISGYVTLLDAGREKILEAGGSCDSVESMAESSPVLREARQALAAHEAKKQEPAALLTVASDNDPVWRGRSFIGLTDAGRALPPGDYELRTAPQPDKQEPVAIVRYGQPAWLIPDSQYAGPIPVEGSLLYTSQQTAPVAQEPLATTWSHYVAGVIGCYLKWPEDDSRLEAVAGIIERRRWAQGTADPLTPLTEVEIEKLREQTFSTNNPFCPVDRKSMHKAVRAAEAAHGITGAKK